MNDATDSPAADQHEHELHTEGHDPAVPAAYSAFMRTGWGDREARPAPAPGRALGAKRRRRGSSERFPGERLVVPTGGSRCAATTPTTGSGPAPRTPTGCGNQTSDAVLVVDPDGDAVLYARPRRPRDTDDSSATGSTASCGSAARPRSPRRRSRLGDRDAPARRAATTLGWITGRDPRAARARRRGRRAARRSERRRPDAELAAALRAAAGQGRVGGRPAAGRRRRDRPRLRGRRARTATGAREHGERWIEGTFGRRARREGNDVGYGTHRRRRRARQHAALDPTTTGRCTPGDLLLLDMGVEGRRALHRRRHPHAPGQRPLHRRRSARSTTWSSRRSDAGIAPVRPGARVPRPAQRRDAGDRRRPAATRGSCRCSAEEALDPRTTRLHRRWTLHGTSHMLGIDVHDCAHARAEAYRRGRPRGRAWCSPSSRACTSSPTT